MKTTQKVMLGAVVLAQLAFAAPIYAAKPTPVVTLETMTIIGHRSAQAVSAAAPVQQAPLTAKLETLVIVGHRSAMVDPALKLAHAQNAPTLARASSL